MIAEYLYKLLKCDMFANAYSIAALIHKRRTCDIFAKATNTDLICS